MVWVNIFFLRSLRVRVGGAKMGGLDGHRGRFSMASWTEPKLACVASGAEERDG